MEKETIREEIDKLKEIQMTSGSMDDYGHGLYNGMELIKATLLKEDPIFANAAKGVVKCIPKPRELEAIQLLETNLEQVFDFLGEHKNYPECQFAGIDPATGEFMIKAPGRDYGIVIGCYIIKDKDGITTASDEYFHETYTIVKEGWWLP